jgi:hypothetical protein
VLCPVEKGRKVEKLMQYFWWTVISTENALFIAESGWFAHLFIANRFTAVESLL